MTHDGRAGLAAAAGDVARLDAASRALATTAARMDGAVRRLDDGARRLDRASRSLAAGLPRGPRRDGLPGGGSARTSLDGLAAAPLETLGSTLGGAAGGFAALDASVGRARAGLVDLGDAGTGALDEVAGAARSMGGALADTFTGALLGTRSLSDGLARLEGRLLRIASRRLVEPVLDRAVGGLLGGVLGGLFGTASPPLVGGARAANGLDFEVGGGGGIDSQLVAFRATPGERVVAIPPGREPAGGGGGVAVTVNVRATDAGSFRRSAGQVMAEAKRAADRAFARNG